MDEKISVQSCVDYQHLNVNTNFPFGLAKDFDFICITSKHNNNEKKWLINDIKLTKEEQAEKLAKLRKDYNLVYESSDEEEEDKRNESLSKIIDKLYVDIPFTNTEESKWREESNIHKPMPKSKCAYKVHECIKKCKESMKKHKEDTCYKKENSIIEEDKSNSKNIEGNNMYLLKKID